jgi:hypothetical protein
VRAEDRLLGTYGHKQLAAGLNISSITSNAWEPGGPWDAEATVLFKLTDARNDLSVGKLLKDTYLSKQPNNKELNAEIEKANAKLEETQRLLAKPVPYRFTIRLVADKK